MAISQKIWSLKWVSLWTKIHGQNSSNSNNFNTSNDSSNFNSENSESGRSTNTVSNNINPDMLQNLMKMFTGSSNNTSSNDSNKSTPNIDINTILKMKSIMEKMR